MRKYCTSYNGMYASLIELCVAGFENEARCLAEFIPGASVTATGDLILGRCAMSKEWMSRYKDYEFDELEDVILHEYGFQENPKSRYCSAEYVTEQLSRINDRAKKAAEDGEEFLADLLLTLKLCYESRLDTEEI